MRGDARTCVCIWVWVLLRKRERSLNADCHGRPRSDGGAADSGVVRKARYIFHAGSSASSDG